MCPQKLPCVDKESEEEGSSRKADPQDTLCAMKVEIDNVCDSDRGMDPQDGSQEQGINVDILNELHKEWSLQPRPLEENNEDNSDWEEWPKHQVIVTNTYFAGQNTLSNK